MRDCYQIASSSQRVLLCKVNSSFLLLHQSSGNKMEVTRRLTFTSLQQLGLDFLFSEFLSSLGSSSTSPCFLGQSVPKNISTLNFKFSSLFDGQNKNFRKSRKDIICVFSHLTSRPITVVQSLELPPTASSSSFKKLRRNKLIFWDSFKNGLRPMLPIVIRYRHHNWFKKSYIGPLLHYYTVQCCLPRFGFAGRESILLCCELWDILVSTILGGIFKNIYIHMTEQSTNTLSQLPCTAIIFSWWARYLERHGY